MDNIILYTIDCPNCKILENKLKSKKISFSICRDLDLMEEKGFSHLPVLSVNGDYLCYKDALKHIEGVVQ